MFVIVDVWPIFHVDFVGMVMICLHSICHVANSISLLFVAMKTKTKFRICAATVLFYVL